jgi:23S rRNA (guanosine2251-2'-O)-methyltransferase
MKSLDFIYGRHAVEALLASNPKAVEKIYMLEGKGKEPRGLDALSTNLVEKFPQNKAQEFEKILREVGLKAPLHQIQGVFCKRKPLLPLDEKTFKEHFEKSYAQKKICALMALDSITDPQNFGSIARSAAVFGISGILWPKDRSVSLTATVAKAASGGLEYLDLIEVTNLKRELEELKKKGFWIIGFSEHAEHVTSSMPCFEKAVLLVGAEDKGLRPSLKKICDLQVSLPTQGPMKSLSAGVAGALAMMAWVESFKRE